MSADRSCNPSKSEDSAAKVELFRDGLAHLLHVKRFQTTRPAQKRWVDRAAALQAVCWMHTYRHRVSTPYHTVISYTACTQDDRTPSQRCTVLTHEHSLVLP